MTLFSSNSPLIIDAYRHVTLMTIAIALLATAFNTFAARRLPMFEGMILYLHIFLWFGVGNYLGRKSTDAARQAVLT